MVEFGSLTDKGMQRSENQDTLLTPPADLPAQIVSDKGLLFVVADGMGGHAGGKEASALAAQVVMSRYYEDGEQPPGPALVRAVQAANAQVLDRAQDPAYAGMGTTIVAAVVLGGTLIVAHVGDSRAYLFREHEARLLTEDHSWVAEQVRSGVLTAKQAQSHSQRHVLMRALGRESEVQVDIGRLELQPGDQLLLCSDGLWEPVEVQDLHSALENPSPQAAAEELVYLANDRGGPDNVTALVIRPLVAEGGEVMTGDRPVPEEPSGLGAWLMMLPGRWRIALVVVAGSLLLVVVAGLVLLLLSAPSSETKATSTPSGAAPTQTLIPVDVNGTASLGSDEQEVGPSLTATLRPVVDSVIVASPGANLRQGPSVAHLVLDTLPLDAFVRVLCWEEGASGSVWYRVSSASGTEGYVWSDLVELQEASLSDVQQCE